MKVRSSCPPVCARPARPLRCFVRCRGTAHHLRQVRHISWLLSRERSGFPSENDQLTSRRPPTKSAVSPPLLRGADAADADVADDADLDGDGDDDDDDDDDIARRERAEIERRRCSPSERRRCAPVRQRGSTGVNVYVALCGFAAASLKLQSKPHP